MLVHCCAPLPGVKPSLSLALYLNETATQNTLNINITMFTWWEFATNTVEKVTLSSYELSCTNPRHSVRGLVIVKKKRSENGLQWRFCRTVVPFDGDIQRCIPPLLLSSGCNTAIVRRRCRRHRHRGPRRRRRRQKVIIIVCSASAAAAAVIITHSRLPSPRSVFLCMNGCMMSFPLP